MEMKLQFFAESANTSVEQRYQQPDYIDVSGGKDSAQYELLGFGVTQLDNSPSAQTTSKRYVNQKSATQSIGSYEWTAPLEFDLIRSEKAIQFIADIGENEKTGADAETLYVKVYLNKPIPEQANKFEAKICATFGIRKKTEMELAIEQLQRQQAETNASQEVQDGAIMELAGMVGGEV